jgi:RNA polymerase sigma-70 factor (sigma-E family)
MDQGHRADFGTFVAANRRSLLRTAQTLAPDRHAAEDLLQSALAKTCVAWSGLHRPELATAYVRRTMYHEQVDRWRRPGRETLTETMPERPVGRDGGDLASTLRLGLHLAVRDALAALSVGQRSVIVLRYFADLSEAETAERLGCSVGTVKSQTHKAMERLRRTGLADLVVDPAVRG